MLLTCVPLHPSKPGGPLGPGGPCRPCNNKRYVICYKNANHNKPLKYASIILKTFYVKNYHEISLSFILLWCLKTIPLRYYIEHKRNLFFLKYSLQDCKNSFFWHMLKFYLRNKLEGCWYFKDIYFDCLSEFISAT